MRDNPYLSLLAVFVPLSLISFGGGQAIIPEIHRQAVQGHQWIGEATFLADYAIARMAPGPTSLIVTLVGWQAAGVIGAVLATVAIFAPSSLLVLALARVWARYRGAPWQKAVERGLAPVAAGLILAASLTLFQAIAGGWIAIALGLVSTALVMTEKVNPLLLIAGGAVAFLAIGQFSP